MKDEFNVDQYGYKIIGSSREVLKNNLIITIFYSGVEDFEVSIPMCDINYFKNILQQANMIEFLSKKSCAYAIAKSISLLFGKNMNQETMIDLEEFLLYEIPNSIILNKNAVGEILSNLPQNDKFLVTHVGNIIKNRRNSLIEKQKSLHCANEKINKDYIDLKEEFKF